MYYFNYLLVLFTEIVLRSTESNIEILFYLDYLKCLCEKFFFFIIKFIIIL